VILFKDVCIEFNSSCKLKNIEFNIKRNEFVFIYNENSLILKILRELLSSERKPDSGIIRWWNEYIPAKGGLGIVYLKNILLLERTLEDNLNFIMEVKGIPSLYHKVQIERIINIVDLKYMLNTKINKFLPYQLIRANIAQALLNFPGIIILEDPMLNIDELNSRGIIHLLEEINKQGITIIYLSSEKSILKCSKKRIIYIETENSRCEKKKDSYV
jgi:cell division transport system ATP-binding protein